jgi:hypothetical protein
MRVEGHRRRSKGASWRHGVGVDSGISVVTEPHGEVQRAEVRGDSASDSGKAWN